MKAIRKSFSGVEVLKGIDFDLCAGEVHVLAGENGAGKSTLMKILAGVYRDHDGEIFLKGRRVRFSSPHEARANGIAIIYQELSLVEPMSVAENLLLARQRVGSVWFDRNASRKAADLLLKEMHLNIDPDRPVEEFPISVRQLVEIARALSLNADILIMDEPTSTLNAQEVDRLFAAIRAVTGRGCGVIYISHKLEEIDRIADRITVLRDGGTVGTSWASDLTRDELIRKMVGRQITDHFPYTRTERGREVLAVNHLTVAGSGSGDRPDVHEVSFSVFEGEIVGLAGVQGSGTSEILHALFGDARGRVHGTITLPGRRTARRTPRSMISQGMVLQTNDRKVNGLVMGMSITGNITLASLARYSPGGWLSHSRERRASAGQAQRLRIRAASLSDSVEYLSGGNQQKVVFAKWLETDPRILLLDDPTRGIDVGAKQEIYELLMQLKGKGCGILLVSSELPELLALSDRILVMRKGEVVREFARGEAIQDEILRAALLDAAGAHA